MVKPHAGRFFVRQKNHGKLSAKIYILTQPMDPEKKSLNFIFPTKYVIPKSLKFSHWPSKYMFLMDARIPHMNRKKNTSGGVSKK